MLITYWIWSARPPRLRSKGNQIGYPDKPEVCRTRSTVTFYNRALHDAINVFDPVTLLELRRAAHLCQILRPASRDQIRDRAVRQRSSVIRQRCQRHQQRTTRVTGFPPTSDPSVISSRLDLQKHHQDQARTSAIKSPIPGSLQINLLFTIRTKQANSLKRDAKLFSSKDMTPFSRHQMRIGGAERDRTADPLLAKQVLSQLSYSPNHRNTCQPTSKGKPSGGSRSQTNHPQSEDGGPGKT